MGLTNFPLDALCHLVFNPNTTSVCIGFPEGCSILTTSPGRWAAPIPALHFMTEGPTQDESG